MATAIVDSAGANLWPGDAVTTPNGAGTLLALLENSAGQQQVVVDIGGVQSTFIPTLVTVTARAAELASTADQSADGEVA